MTRLTKLANELMCDKGTEHYEAHGYTELYAQLVPEHGKCSLLEIGVKYGSSLWMWNHWNKNIKVTGIDIEPLCCPLAKNVSVFVGSQSDYKFIRVLIEHVVRGFDVIIDDGSHRYGDIMSSFVFLWPYLNYGGYYIIEDLHAPQARKSNVIDDVHCRIQSSPAWSSRMYFNDKMMVIRKSISNKWPVIVNK